MSAVQVHLPDEAATLAVGAGLAQAWRRQGGAGLITLRGPLGSGKTTLVRGFLQALGYTGRVRSPTYTLLETYDIGGRSIWHLDLYRLASAAELECLGYRDLDLTVGIAFVEWPERVPRLEQDAAVAIELTYAAPGRRLIAEARSAPARRLLAAWRGPAGPT